MTTTAFTNEQIEVVNTLAETLPLFTSFDELLDIMNNKGFSLTDEELFELVYDDERFFGLQRFVD